MAVVTQKTVNGVFWLKHCGSWFGFAEKARFQQHEDGGYFASEATGKQIHTIQQNGFSEPQ